MPATDCPYTTFAFELLREEQLLGLYADILKDLGRYGMAAHFRTMQVRKRCVRVAVTEYILAEANNEQHD